MNCHWSHITKHCLDWDSNPRPGNVELELPQYAAWSTRSQATLQRKREKAPYDCLMFHTVFQWGVH